MEEILNQILYGSMLGSRNIVESLIGELKKDSATVPIVKKFMAFLHSKDEKNVEQLKEKLALFSKNDDFLKKINVFLEAYPYTGESCTIINLDTNIPRIKSLIEKVEDPILIELFSTRISKSVKDISSHYEKASFLLKERGFEKLSSQAFAWYLKWKCEKIQNVEESADYDRKAAECFKKSGEKELYHDALGLANIKLMSSTTDLEEQIKYSRKASYHYKKSGNVQVFRMKEFRRINALKLYELAKNQDSLLEAAKYFKEAANEFKIGEDEVFYHRTMALYYKCKLIGAKDWNDKAKIFSKIAIHSKKGNEEGEYYKALGDKYNSLSRTGGSLEKIPDLLKKASLNYQKAGDNLSSHQALGAYYQSKAIIVKNTEKGKDFFLKAAEEFEKGKSLSNYYNAIGHAKIFSLLDSDKIKPILWKEIAEKFKKSNTIDMYFLSMHNYYFSEFRLTEDAKEQILYKKKAIKALKGFVDQREIQQTTRSVDEFLISKTGIDSKNLLALYKGKYYRFSAEIEKESEQRTAYYKKAIECFALVVHEYPNVTALRELGWIFFNISSFEVSFEFFKEAGKLAPDNESIKVEIEIAEKALIKDYVKTKEECEKEKQARKKFEEQSIKSTDISYGRLPKFHKDAFMDRILRVLFDAGRNFEKRYETFAKFKEPELRDVLLFFLNNEFEDGATGETIQGAGKTDIHIKNPDDHREIVIVECKKWDGEKRYLEGFNQKMGYLTGREKKSIILTFSNRIHFSEVSDKAKEAIERDKAYIESSIKNLESGSDIHEANFVSEHKLGKTVKIKVYHLFFNLGFKSS